MALTRRSLKAIFQSTPSVGRATEFPRSGLIALLISIHALRGEGDDICYYIRLFSDHISIHALRGEGDKDFLRIWLIR